MKPNEILNIIHEKQIHGILPGTQGLTLAKAALQANGPFIEIGVLCGLSTSILTLAQKEGGTVISVDPFKMDLLSDMAKDVVQKTGEPDGDTFINLWRSNVAKVSKDKNNIPVCGLSTNQRIVFLVEEILSELEPAGLLFVDGSHDYEVVKKEIKLYLPLLAKDAIIVFHDYAKGWGAYDAINEALNANIIEKMNDQYILVTRKK